ncbi:late expression factor 4 [Tomelloso virus]|uniref:Late expression factor 4 n=1 Tax=Tomelloso virus TaxID=2053981 RepID=A0A2H4T2P9_9VIRU|nr:late expression factor 4 [Tomelloso virus]ATY70197.1 late expression factor 4 [Tomelloso virus]
MHSCSKLNSEWETTISINSIESEYLQALNNENHKTDVIFLLSEGMRLSNRTVQKKTTTSKRRLLTYYKQQWTPLERTIAIEEACHPTKTLIVEKCIHRVIIYESGGLRISHNKEVCALGEKYNIEYEIEYPEKSEYSDILRCERKLIKTFLQHNHVIKRDIMTRIDMFSCVMSKVQMWNCFDANQSYLWAYKWNGIKSKILITDCKSPNDDASFITYVWSDNSTITNKMCRGKNIHHLINICCAVEIMDDKIIIIEAIGTMIDGEIYTTEPMANASFLKHLDSLLADDVYIDDKPLQVQRFYPPELPNSYGKDCDGFVIIQNDLIIKWKIPTIDVKCVTPYTFKVGSQMIPLNFIGEPGKIYEITYKNEVLRQRNDRLAASSDQEYAVFMESSKMLLDSEPKEETQNTIQIEEISPDEQPMVISMDIEQPSTEL